MAAQLCLKAGESSHEKTIISAIKNKTKQKKKSYVSKLGKVHATKRKKFSKKKQNKTKQKQKIYGVKTLDFYVLRYDYRKQNEICVSCLQENHHLVDYNTAAFANSLKKLSLIKLDINS